MDDSGKYGSFAMTSDELARFCSMEADQAVLTSLRKDGAPFGIPLGFVYSGDCFHITTGKDVYFRYIALREIPKATHDGFVARLIDVHTDMRIRKKCHCSTFNSFWAMWAR